MKANKKYSLFNYSMFLNAVKQLRVSCLICFGILTLFTVLVPIGKAINVSHYELEYALPVVISVKTSFIYMYLIYMLFTPFITLHLFSFLTKRNTSDYYHSFPQKRGCIFTTYFLVIAAWLFVMVFGSGVLSVIVYSCLSKYLIFNFITLVQFVISIYLASLLVAASILIACQITGTLFTNFVVSGLVIFLPRMLLTAVVSIVSSSSSIFVSDKLVPILDNKYNIVFNSVYSIIRDFNVSSMTSILAMLYTLILIIIYFFVGRLLYIKRKSEVAGNASVNGALQCVIRIGLALPICFISVSKLFSYVSGNNSLNDNDFFWIIVCFIVAIVIMLVYELISTKKLAKVVKALPSIGILAVVNVVVFIMITCIYNVEISYRPAADDIDYVKIMDNNFNFDGNYFTAKLNTYKITDRETIKYISEGLSNTIENEKSGDLNYRYNDQVMITAAIKSGIVTKYRNISFSREDYNKFNSVMMNCDDIKDIYTILPPYNKNTMSFAGNFTTDEKREIYNSMRKEVKNIDYTKWYKILEFQNAPITLQMNTVVDDISVNAYMPLTDKTPETLLKYLNFSNNKSSKEEFEECIEYFYNQSNSDGFCNMSITSYTDDFLYFDDSYSYDKNSPSDEQKFTKIINNIKENYTAEVKNYKLDNKKLVHVEIEILKDSSLQVDDKPYFNVDFFTYIDNDIADEVMKSNDF